MNDRLADLLGFVTQHRRPLAFGLLMVLPFAVLLGPLAVDLFFAIPWSVRKAAGWVIVAALAALALLRVVSVKPGESWVPQEPPDDHRSRPWADRSLPWLLQAATASLAWPFLREPEALPLGDWDLYLAHFEAARRSILLWNQFPWWGPYSSGGFPLAGNPQVGVVSPGMALVLLFGTSVGLRLATILWMMIAVEGTRRLAMLWLREPWGAALAALVYGLNGGVLIYSVAGYYVPLNYWVLPWLLLCVIRLGEPGPRGFALGAWLALAVLTGIHYLLIFSGCVAAVIGLRHLRFHLPVPGQPARIARQLLVGFGVALALTGWRLATTAHVVLDFPHEQAPSTVQSLLYALLCWTGRPSPTELASTTEPIFWETNAYVGLLVVGLAAVSLRHGLRWWHLLAAVAFWLAFGGWSVWHPSYWLGQLPVFRSTHVVSRWRLVAALGVGLAAGSTVARWRSSQGTWGRRLAAFLVILVGADLIGYGHSILPLAFSRPRSSAPDPGPPVRNIVQIGDGPEAIPVERGYGVIRAHETQLGYDRDRPTARRARGEPGYRGEAWTEAGPIEPELWSPNLLVFCAQPGQRVEVNQNPGSWWLVNGQPDYASMRCAETSGTLSGLADSSGRLVLRIAPPWLAWGWACQGIGLLMIAAAPLVEKSWNRRHARGREKEDPSA